MPKGMRAHLYRPNGVPKVVRSLDSSSNSQCQNPLRTSATLYTRAWVISGRTSSSVGIGKWHRLRARFNGWGSRQSLRDPLGFRTVTRCDIQSVGWSTRSIVPIVARRSNSSFKGCFIATGTRRIGSWDFFTVGSTSKCTSPWKQPRSP